MSRIISGSLSSESEGFTRQYSIFRLEAAYNSSRRVSRAICVGYAFLPRIARSISRDKIKYDRPPGFTRSNRKALVIRNWAFGPTLKERARF